MAGGGRALAAAPGRARGPERRVARQLFYFLAGRIDEKALTAAWETAKLGIGKRSLAGRCSERIKGS